MLFKSNSVELKKQKSIYSEINEREKISKVYNKYVTALDFSDKTLHILLVTCSVFFIASSMHILGWKVQVLV